MLRLETDRLVITGFTPEMARAALHLLVDQIEAADKTKSSRQHIVFNASLLEGETT